MPPLFDDVVSPELVLVDADLGERAREALPPRGGRRHVGARSAAAAAVAPGQRRARRAVVPALTLCATVAASLIVTAFTGAERDARERAAHATPDGGARSRAVPMREAFTPASTARPRDGGGKDVVAGEAQGRHRSAASPPATPPASRRPKTAYAARSARRLASSTTIVWRRAAAATAYDLELVRDGSVIYSATSTSPHAVVPQRWRRQGVTYSIKPEDQTFVWPVVDGRRAAAPVVDGALALDLTPVAGFAELGQGAARP